MTKTLNFAFAWARRYPRDLRAIFAYYSSLSTAIASARRLEARVDTANTFAVSYILRALELAFETKTLRDLCEKEEKARRELGPEVAEKLKHRLADLRAAESVQDLVIGRPRETQCANPGCFVIDLADGCSLAFCANHRKVPLLTSGGVDWAKVSRVKILRIENAHGQQRLRA